MCPHTLVQCLSISGASFTLPEDCAEGRKITSMWGPLLSMVTCYQKVLTSLEICTHLGRPQAVQECPRVWMKRLLTSLPVIAEAASEQDWVTPGDWIADSLRNVGT